MDYNQRAKHVADAATGQVPYTTQTPAALGKVSGKARGSHLGAARRSEFAQKAAETRWNKRTAA